ncbi:hypothetical protein STPYR_10069 [uncultured Stenotrophomonas sp.]|uniref:Polyphosphate kinase N-terminal domain-containing protein n=1 Tax=uncultured Stenotrophomonas sp. TaxID=165438 RepID=A0A1Y5PYS1_9GAMM|nr:hypothetical protein STPYR_10069 [uncultured Stenotrophomonas sp.]
MADPLRDPALYINRELSQLDFNFRVLAQAMDAQVPLLERLRFLCISCTNLDEFFEIRAAAVRHAQEFGLPPAPDGLSPQQILSAIHDRAAELVDQQYRCWNEVLRPALQEAGIGILSFTSSTSLPIACIFEVNDRMPMPASASCRRRHGPRVSAAGCARSSATRSCRCCRRWGWTPRTRSRRSSTSR